MRAVVLAILLWVGLALCPTACVAQAGGVDAGRAARIKADLREILSSPQYRIEAPQESAFSRILRKIGDGLKAFFRWLGRLFRFPSGLGGSVGGGGNLFFWVILVGVIVAMAYVIAYALRQAAKRREGDARKRRPGIISEPEESAAASPDDWLTAARRHAASGDFHRAYRAVFIALLLRLDRLGAIQFERSRTNGEYLRQLRARQPLYQLMSTLARDFDARWYGRAPVAEDDYQRVLRAFESVPTAP
jgi:hypothetical protein